MPAEEARWELHTDTASAEGYIHQLCAGCCLEGLPRVTTYRGGW